MFHLHNVISGNAQFWHKTRRGLQASIMMLRTLPATLFEYIRPGTSILKAKIACRLPRSQLIRGWRLRRGKQRDQITL
jgi:hypothetical protein